MYFTTGPLRAMERAMQQPPRYKKGGGLTVLRTPWQDMACVDLGSGSYCYQALVNRFLRELDAVALTGRIKTIQKGNEGHEMLFRDAAHKRRFNTLRSQQTISAADSQPLMSALFLLSADDFLWQRSRNAIHAGRIDFSAINIRGIPTASYAVYQTARDLYQGTRHITLSDLTDPELVDDRLLRLLINSFLVRRHGLAALGVKQ